MPLSSSVSRRAVRFLPQLSSLPVAYALLAVSVAWNYSIGTGGLPLAIASLALLLLQMRKETGSAPSHGLLIVLIGALAFVASHRLPNPRQGACVFLVPLLVTAAGGILGCVHPRWAGWRGMAAMSIGTLASGWLTITLLANPHIDVFSLQTGGANDLLAGNNPYAGAYPNIYTAEESRAFLGGTPLQITSYPYPPLILLLTTLGQGLAGDVRASLLIGQIAVGLVLWRLALASRCSPRQAHGVAALHFVNPMNAHVLTQAWNDTIVALLFVVLLLALVRRRFGGAVLGLALASKQYSVVALPFLLAQRFVPRRLWLAAAAAGAAVFLPFVLWAPVDFWQDLTGHVAAPFRADTMAIPAALVQWVQWMPPRGLHMMAALLIAAATWRRLPSGPHGLALGLGCTYLALFLFSYQGACNYYYLVGVLILAAAATVCLPVPVTAYSGRHARESDQPENGLVW